ncbi:MAG TPA: sigma-70 family RNA polymerase sigma factor, partial [Gemmatimonadales bacterium]
MGFARRPSARMKADLSPLELEEAVQDVCIKLQTRKVLAQLRAASTPRGYLVRMLRNAAIDRLRQDVRGLRRFERDLPLADTVGCYSLGAAPSDTALPDAVAQLLSDEERALFRECYVLRRPIGEIAASRGISPSAANGRLRRLRERLRAMKDGSHMRKRKTRKRNVNLERLRAAGEANGVPWGVSWNQIAERAKVEHSTITRL